MWWCCSASRSTWSATAGAQGRDQCVRASSLRSRVCTTPSLPAQLEDLQLFCVLACWGLGLGTAMGRNMCSLDVLMDGYCKEYLVPLDSERARDAVASVLALKPATAVLADTGEASAARCFMFAHFLNDHQAARTTARQVPPGTPAPALKCGPDVIESAFFDRQGGGGRQCGGGHISGCAARVATSHRCRCGELHGHPVGRAC